jgi:hypothetical protein
MPHYQDGVFDGRLFITLETVNGTQRWKRSSGPLELLLWKHPDAPYGCALVLAKNTLIRSEYGQDPHKLVAETVTFALRLRDMLSKLPGSTRMF